MKVDLHSEDPQRPLEQRLGELLRDAVHIDLAVAFVTDYGASVIQEIRRRLSEQATTRLLVSVCFPTDLDKVAELAQEMKVRLHLGYPDSRWQFHSKVILVEHRDQSRSIVVGSHNWTTNGLAGGNLEASLVLECDHGDRVASQTSEHISRCWEDPRCEDFDASHIEDYRQLQREFHDNLNRKTRREPFPGFVATPGETVLILAEAAARQPAKVGHLYFTVPKSCAAQFSTDAPASILVYPKGGLFLASRPLVQPFRYIGTVLGSHRQTLKVRRDVQNYVIQNIEEPIIESMKELPNVPRNHILVEIQFKRGISAKAIPLYHAGDEPHVTQTLDSEGQYAYGHDGEGTLETSDSWSKGLVAEDGRRRVRNGLIAQSTLKVPFLSIYPSKEKLVGVLERFGDRQAFFGGNTPCRVKLRGPTQPISKYVCFVQYMSGTGLTRELYSSLGDSEP